MSDLVKYEAKDGIATLTLNRPERLNAMSDELVEGTVAAVEMAASDAAVRVLIMTGAGRAFCVGGDLKGLSEGELVEPVPVETQTAGLRRRMMSAQLLHEMPKVTIAAVNGPCAGAGMSWACAADLRFAAESAVFRTAFLTAGLSGDFGGTWTITQLLGSARARELFFLNERIDAKEALRIGLVTKVVPDAELMPYVNSVARQLADSAPLALGWMKEDLNSALRMNLSEALDGEASRHVRSMRTEDAKEAASAFVGKRAPKFVGR